MTYPWREYITQRHSACKEQRMAWWWFSEDEEMIPLRTMIPGDYEDTEMGDGIGLKHLIRLLLNNPSQDINTAQCSKVHWCLWLVVGAIRWTIRFSSKSTTPKRAIGINSLASSDSVIRFGSWIISCMCTAVSTQNNRMYLLILFCDSIFSNCSRIILISSSKCNDRLTRTMQLILPGTTIIIITRITGEEWK